MLRGLSSLVFLSLLVTAPLARADSFSFSFTNTMGTTAGTVTGEIFGLIDNTTGPATQVLITSFPVGLDSVLGSGPIDAMLWDQQFQNSFTESGGQVTDGNFWAQDTILGIGDGAQLYINGESGYNFLNLDGTDALFVWGDSGIAAANVNSVPEPSSFLLFATGLAVALGASRRKFRL